MSPINSNTLALTRADDNAYHRANIKYGRSPGMSLLASYRAGLLFTLLALVSPAQDYRGRIQGTVRDTSDAVIAGATVTLHNANTGISTARKTNETGHYIFDLVEPGSY